YPGPIGNLKDSRRESITVTVPSDAAGSATLYDELGNSTPYDRVSAKSGQVTIKDLELRGGQIAIIKSEK
ncbi:MAG TPA: hypothetical protein VF889_06640, partial [Bacteroidota bacterium]